MSLSEEQGCLSTPAVQTTSAMANHPQPQGPPTTFVAPPPTIQIANDQMIYDPNAIPLPDRVSNGREEEDSLSSPPLLQPLANDEGHYQPVIQPTSSWRPTLRPHVPQIGGSSAQPIPQQLDFGNAEAIPIVDEDLDMSMQAALWGELGPDEALPQNHPNVGEQPYIGEYSPDSTDDLMEDYLSPMVQRHIAEHQGVEEVSSLQTLDDYSKEMGTYDVAPPRPSRRFDDSQTISSTIETLSETPRTNTATRRTKCANVIRATTATRVITSNKLSCRKFTRCTVWPGGKRLRSSLCTKAIPNDYVDESSERHGSYVQFNGS